MKSSHVVLFFPRNVNHVVVLLHPNPETLSEYNKIEGDVSTQSWGSAIISAVLVCVGYLLSVIPLFWFCYLRVFDQYERYGSALAFN